jgi:hypothetical protein
MYIDLINVACWSLVQGERPPSQELAKASKQTLQGADLLGTVVGVRRDLDGVAWVGGQTQGPVPGHPARQLQEPFLPPRASPCTTA